MVAISCFLTLCFAYQHINVLGFEPAHDSICLCGVSMFLQLHFRKEMPGGASSYMIKTINKMHVN